MDALRRAAAAGLLAVALAGCAHQARRFLPLTRTGVTERVLETRGYRVVSIGFGESDVLLLRF
jgi:hypothetical protein